MPRRSGPDGERLHCKRCMTIALLLFGSVLIALALSPSAPSHRLRCALPASFAASASGRLGFGRCPPHRHQAHALPV
jgi:hypothetical protein